MNSKSTIGLISRILLGLIFVASAAMKYLSIEATDMFLFEHKLLPWTLTQFATRLLIAFEAGLGIMLIIGIKPRLTRVLTFLIIILFTIYLLLKPILFGNTDENCHCFGNYIQLNHIQSIIKNVIMLLLACMIHWVKGWQTRFSTLIITVIALLTTATSLIINSPDIILTKVYPNSIEVNKEGFDVLMQQEDVKKLGLEEGKKILCLYSTGCKYCKKTAKKLEIMIQRHGFNHESFATIFWGSEANIVEFRTLTQTPALPTALVHPLLFLKATKGKQPIIVLLDNGKITQVFNSRTLSEQSITNFLAK